MAGKFCTEKNPISSISTGKVISANDPMVDGYEDYHTRCNQTRNIVDFLKSDKASSLVQYNQIARILSIGTGYGDIENHFLSLCKNAEQFVGIEPVSTRCDEALKCITTGHPHIKVTFYNGVFEDYEEPDEKLDVVLLSHVLYHFKDLSSTIKRAAAMVRSGGKVFILVSHDRIKVKLGGVDAINFDKQIGEAIEDNNLLYTEVALPDTEVDLTHEGNGYYDFVPMMMEIPMSIEKRKECIGKLMQFVVPGTNIVLSKHKAFIIQK